MDVYPNIYIIVVLFVLGLIIGSFLNVCIYRIPKRETVVYNASSCFECNKKLEARDLVPVFSYLILQGRCRHCHSRVSPRYPLVEGLTGFVFVLTYFYFGPELLLIKYLFIFSLLIVISFIDIDHRIIPNKLLVVLFVWTLFWQFLHPEISLYNAGIGALIGGGFFLLTAILSKGGMGGGDIKLMFVAGFFLGSSLTALTIFMATLSGGLFGLILIALKIKGRKDPISFGPFISLGIFISVMFGECLLELYLRLFVG